MGEICSHKDMHGDPAIYGRSSSDSGSTSSGKVPEMIQPKDAGSPDCCKSHDRPEH